MSNDDKLNGQIKALVVLSGKRMSGKDFVGERLAALLERELCVRTMFLHAPLALKSDFAARHGLDVQRLCDDRDYKELHRPAMTRYLEDVLASHGDTYFCQLLRSAHMERAAGPTVCLMDVRYRFELDYYRGLCTGAGAPPLVAIRLDTPQEVRAARGWCYAAAVDCHPSETDLDAVDGWDFVFANSVDGAAAVEEFAQRVVRRLAISACSSSAW